MSNVNYHNYKISYLDQIKKRRREIIKKKKTYYVKLSCAFYTKLWTNVCVCVFITLH